ncbi:MAG: Sua5/YciO/YrdC/YwlC family protein, partial [Planctomycetota bacterium]
MPTNGPIAGRSPADRDKAAERAADALRRGGVAVLPTETVYGIFTAATADAVDRLDAFTHRPNPGAGPRATLHLPDLTPIRASLHVPEATTRRLLDRLCPGPVRFVIDQPEHALAAARAGAGVEAQLIDDGTCIAFRVPDHPVARRVLRDAGVPCVARRLGAASWALGDDPGTSIAVIPDHAEPRPDAVVDDGETLHRSHSTTIRIASGGRISVDPGGVLSERAVMEQLERLILFVCTGNTCRSPMARAIAQRMIDERAYEGITTRAESAGVAAGPGVPASPDAVAVL